MEAMQDISKEQDRASGNRAVMGSLSRKLEDRTEHYSSLSRGKCKCGTPVIKVLGSDCTCWVNGNRYHYPWDNTASCVFRCRDCGEPIDDTWQSC